MASHGVGFSWPVFGWTEVGLTKMARAWIELFPNQEQTVLACSRNDMNWIELNQEVKTTETNLNWNVPNPIGSTQTCTANPNWHP